MTMMKSTKTNCQQGNIKLEFDVAETIIGFTLLERYVLKDLQSTGLDSHQFIVLDKKDPERQLIAKLSHDICLIKKEIDVMRRVDKVLNKYKERNKITTAYDKFQKVEACGMFSLLQGKAFPFEQERELRNQSCLGFYVVQGFGGSLARDFKPILENPLKHDGIYEIGIQLLDLLEVIHTAGYVYN